MLRSTLASRGLTVVALGLDQITLVAVNIRQVYERDDVVRMVGAE